MNNTLAETLDLLEPVARTLGIGLGKVVDGLDVIDAVTEGTKIEKIVVSDN